MLKTRHLIPLLLLNSIFITFLLANLGNCITPTEQIYGSGTKFYSSTPGQIIFSIKKFSSKTYFQVFGFYGKIEILNSEETVIATLDGGEKDFNFQYEDTIYYLIFNPPDPFQFCGFQVLSDTTEYTNLLTSSMTLYFLKEKEFELEVRNEQAGKKLVTLLIGLTYSSGTAVKSGSIIENGESFVLPFEVKKYDYNLNAIFNILLDQSLIFKPIIICNRTNINSISQTKIKMEDLSPDLISNDNLFCKSEGIFFYQMSNSLKYYMLSFEQNTEIFFLKSNIDRRRATPMKIENATSLLFLFRCFKRHKMFLCSFYR